MKRLHTKKIRFYIKHGLQSLVPRFYLQQRLPAELARAGNYDPRELTERVDYYCKINGAFQLPHGAKTYRDLSASKLPSMPCLDLKQYLRYFPSELPLDCNLGDLTTVPPQPTFVKCRPVGDDNANSVLMKLNAARFFDFKKDHLAFHQKKAVAVFRGPCYQAHRQKFVQQCYNLPQTDIRDTRKAVQSSPTFGGFLSPGEQLRNKFIISVEGNDVASNIVWIMASNSLAFMTKPKFEGWFMQGRLIPDHHFVRLRDDYADLPEKIDFYSRNPAAALKIIANAQKHVVQFFDEKRERLILLLVINKYFSFSSQLEK
jgi:hypothetical protein